MVRLKVKGEFFMAVKMFVFQFHNGSIKSIISEDAAKALLRFQFHNGSIKSLYRVTWQSA